MAVGPLCNHPDPYILPMCPVTVSVHASPSYHQDALTSMTSIRDLDLSQEEAKYHEVLNVPRRLEESCRKLVCPSMNAHSHVQHSNLVMRALGWWMGRVLELSAVVTKLL